MKIICEWIEAHDGILPDRASSNKQEQHYYAVLRKIQSKYEKYLGGFEEFEDLEDEEREDIQEILSLATEINLWDADLPPIPKTKGKKDVEMNPFEITGVMKDFVEVEEEVEEIEGRKLTFDDVLDFCREYGRLPKSRKKGEISLYKFWNNSDEKKRLSDYSDEGLQLEEIPEEYRELAKIIIFDCGYKPKKTKSQKKLAQAVVKDVTVEEAGKAEQFLDSITPKEKNIEGDDYSDPG